MISCNTVRRPAVAGRFYPAGAETLRREVKGCLECARPQHLSSPKALIAPHAGYAYSGPVAGSAFAHWRDRERPLERVILIGPSHYFSFRGIAASHAGAFATPLGEVMVDLESVALLEKMDGVIFDEEAHRDEHALEVELPFLQVVLGECPIVPLLVGDSTPGHVGSVLGRLWGGPETGVVISSDLSHYLSHDAARGMDSETARAIEALDPKALDGTRACGWLAIAGLLVAARIHGLRAITVDLRNSGDTAGPRDRVVGYGAFVLGNRQSD